MCYCCMKWFCKVVGYLIFVYLSMNCSRGWVIKSGCLIWCSSGLSFVCVKWWLFGWLNIGCIKVIISMWLWIVYWVSEGGVLVIGRGRFLLMLFRIVCIVCVVFFWSMRWNMLVIRRFCFYLLGCIVGGIWLIV